ncbi:MAG: hypothetical protein KDD69_06355 [Bdellovibrionales bacterium]|nr:hypothetical protein [Bdellovibrionales bacterium]
MKQAFPYPRLANFLLLAAAATYFCTSIHSPVFFESLTIGHWIETHQAIPTEYLWSTAGAGQPWRSPSWLFELLLSLSEQLFGDQVFIVLKMLLLTCLVCGLSWLYACRARNAFIGTFIALPVSAGMLITAVLGPHLVGWLGAVLLIELAYRARLGEGTPLRALAVSFLVGVLLANSDASSAFAVLVSAVVLLSPAVEGEVLAPRAKRLGMVLVLVLSQLVTPYGGLQLLTIAQSFLFFLSLELGQRLNPGTVFQYQVSFLVLLWIVLVLLWPKHRRLLNGGEMLLAVGSTVLALASWKAAPYALLLVGLCTTLVWGRAQLSELGNLGEALSAFRQSMAKLPPLGTLWLLLCVLIVNVLNLWKVPFTKVLLPAREVDYLLEQPMDGALLHERFIGGYLVYRFADGKGRPRKLAAITDRSAFLDQPLAKSEVELETLSPGWKEYFAQLDPKRVLCRIDSTLYQVLTYDRSWELTLLYGFPPQSEPAAMLTKKGAFGWALFSKAAPESVADSESL